MSNRFTVGQTVSQVSDYGTVRKGTVVKVTASGRTTVKMQNADGHTFESTFTNEGRRFPKHSMDRDGRLAPWTNETELKWDEQVAHYRRLARSNAARERREQEEGDLDAVAMRYTLTLLSQSRAPAAKRAIAVINRFGFKE